MNAQTAGVLTVMDRMIRSVGARNDHTRDADLAAAHEALATVEGLINALSALADAADARGIPVDAARAALAKAQGGAA